SQARAAARSARNRAADPSVLQKWAARDPIAQVLVDLPLAHLDRVFDYRVPAALDEPAQPGVRVKVRFAGRQVSGFILNRVPDSEQQRLQPLLKVVSAEPVLTPEVATLAEAVAQRYVGTRADVLRLAIPPRHARVEAEPGKDPVAPSGWRALSEEWQHYQGFQPLLHGPHRAVLTVAPGDDWTHVLTASIAATAACGKGVIICVPDGRDVNRLDQAMRERLGEEHHVVLTADLGPAARYRAFLQLTRGERHIVIGTRAAAFAPVANLGLVVIWDDGDDLYQEPRAPYCHTREVLLLRAHLAGAGALLAGYARSVESEYLIRTGWAAEVTAPREVLRGRITVGVTGDAPTDLARDAAARTARLPSEAHQLIREAVALGPVLVQTPRAGYATRLACERCWEPARCERCNGPLGVSDPGSPLACAWCAVSQPNWACGNCGGKGLRAPVLGHSRTAEEIGRAFPGVRIRTSSGERVLEAVDSGIVVATTGAEPVAPNGYSAVIIMDTWLTLARSDLRAVEEAVRRWANAIALCAKGGRALLIGDGHQTAIQALIRWDLSGLAQREMAERQQAHLPPASRMFQLQGQRDQLEALVASLSLPEQVEALGPVELADELAQLVLRVPRAQGDHLAQVLRGAQAARSVRKLPHVRVRVDPHDLG
ncbi:MAG TPA: primosomal protein N', partial [Marmoricola sp.]|nr:primosomal protein N' [Marmoricola sp.]